MSNTPYKQCQKCGKWRHKQEMILRDSHRWCAFCIEEENAQKKVDDALAAKTSNSTTT